jgi:hypothetical protein
VAGYQCFGWPILPLVLDDAFQLRPLSVMTDHNIEVGGAITVGRKLDEPNVEALRAVFNPSVLKGKSIDQAKFIATLLKGKSVLAPK